MVKCPVCDNEIELQYKENKLETKECPSCFQTIYIYNKYTYRHNPIETFMTEFYKEFSKFKSRESNTEIEITIHKRNVNWSYEYSQARLLLDDVEYNLNLAIEAMRWIFSNSRYSWKINSSIRDLIGSWIVATGVIKSRIKKAEEEQVRLDEMREIAKRNMERMYGKKD